MWWLGSYCEYLSKFENIHPPENNTLLKIKRTNRRCSIKKSDLKNFSKFSGKPLCQSLFFNKVAGGEEALAQMFFACNVYLKRDSGTGVFLWNNATPFLKNTSGWLLLKDVPINRSDRPDVFCEKAFRKNSAKFTKKHLYQKLFLFWEFFQSTSLTEYRERLLLECLKGCIQGPWTPKRKTRQLKCIRRATVTQFSCCDIQDPKHMK